MRCAVRYRDPSGPVKPRSSGVASGPRRAGSRSAAVFSFASLYCGDCTIAA
jgi:hypothetical protein